MTLPTFHMIAGAPDPVAPFSHGQMPFTGKSATSPYPKGIEAQTRQVMDNLKRVLAGCGLALKNVVAARVFLVRFARDYDAMNRVYAGYFRAAPARSPMSASSARGS